MFLHVPPGSSWFVMFARRVFPGDCSRDRPQLDRQPGDQQDVGTLLVRQQGPAGFPRCRSKTRTRCLPVQAERGSHGLPREDDWQVFGERAVPPVQGHGRLEGPAGFGENLEQTLVLEPGGALRFFEVPGGSWSWRRANLPPAAPQVKTFGVDNPLTNLVPSLQEVDPDDAFSSVPYEKGFALLYHLEELLGGPGELPCPGMGPCWPPGRALHPSHSLALL